jgi:flagellar FliL protein
MITNEKPPLAAPGAAREPTVLAWLALLGVLTLCALAAGSALGLLLGVAPSSKASGGAVPSSSTSGAKYGGNTDMLQLPPVITNLADSDSTWVRLQASIVFDRTAVPKPDVLATKISEDILGFMRTLSMAQIGGPSGLQHLREDLNERASIRSGGLVREIILQTLLVQ